MNEIKTQLHMKIKEDTLKVREWWKRKGKMMYTKQKRKVDQRKMEARPDA